MRGLSSRALVQTFENQFSPIQGSWGGIVPSLTPKKNGNEESSNSRRTVSDENAVDPIVAFSRPPWLPPILGPLVALSFYDSWSKQNSNNDG